MFSENNDKQFHLVLLGVIAVSVVIGVVGVIKFLGNAQSVVVDIPQVSLVGNVKSDVSGVLNGNVDGVLNGSLNGEVISNGTQQDLGSAVTLYRSGENSNFYELGLIDDTKAKLKVSGFGYNVMPVAGVTTTTAPFLNDTGSDMYIDVDSFAAIFTGTSSSSVKIACGTSTYSGLALYTTAIPANVLNLTTVATSTVEGEQDAIKTSTVTDNHIVLEDDQYLLCGWSQENNGCTGAFCEAVTSTARGYEATVNFDYWYIKAY